MFYYVILTFNLAMTFVIGDMLLDITGIVLYILITRMVFMRYGQWSAVYNSVGRGALS